MPTVPYNPIAGASPSGQGSPYFTDRGATEQAFGAGIGQSIEKFGTQLERTADVVQGHVLQAQAFINEADVNAAVTADIQTSGELNNKFRLLSGNQAQDGLEDHVKSLQKNREDLRSTLKNPMAQKMFDQQTMHRFALDVVNSSQHAATQAKQYTKQTYADQEVMIIQDAAKKAREGDAGAIQDGAKQLIELNKKAAGLDDDSPDTIKRKNIVSVTKLISASAPAKATYDPKGAQRMFDSAKKSGMIDEGQVESIQHNIDQKSIQFYSVRDANEITSNRIQSDPTSFDRNPQGKMNEMLADAKTKADELYPPSDPRNVALNDAYLKQLTTNIQTNANVLKNAYTDQTNDMKNFVGRIADQIVPATGRKPINEQELNAIDPRAGQALIDANRRDPSFNMRSKFLVNSTEEKVISQDQLDQQLKLWRGKEKNEKLQTDVNQLFLDGKINHKLMEKMETDKANIKKESYVEAMVAPIMSTYEAERNAAGIFKSKTDEEANTKYIWFRGSLIAHLNEEQTRTGQPVPRGSAREKEIFNSVIKEATSKDSGFWASLFGSTKRQYEIENENKPPFVQNTYPDATWNPKGRKLSNGEVVGAWQVWRDGKKLNVDIPGENK